jgi:hypothetical protein
MKLALERRVRWYQRPLYEHFTAHADARAIEIAHRRWGKDEVALWGTCEWMLKRPASYWHCLPQFEQARRALWTAVNPRSGKRRIDEAFPPELRENTNEQEMFIRFKNGATWQLIGSDRYNTLVGAGVAGVVFSEWALANPSSWAYIRPMVEENGGYALFITTPRGRNHAHAMYEMAKGAPRWFAELSSIQDTGALSADAIAEAKAEYASLYGEDVGHAQFEQEYLCSFNASIMGAFYAREMAKVRAEGRITAFEPKAGPVHRAWDIGVDDDTSIWWFQLVRGVVHLIDCYSNHSAGVDHYAEECRKRGWPQGNDYVPHDAKAMEWGGGRTRVEQMMRHGLNPIVVPMASKADGIQAARLTLQTAVFHARTEQHGVAALEMYRRKWDDQRKIFSADEYRDWSTHLADAFRYLALAWREDRPKPREPERPRELVLEGRSDGSIVGNMSVREAVEAMARRRQREMT